MFNLNYGSCEQCMEVCWCNILSVGLHVKYVAEEDCTQDRAEAAWLDAGVSEVTYMLRMLRKLQELSLSVADWFLGSVNQWQGASALLAPLAIQLNHDIFLKECGNYVYHIL